MRQGDFDILRKYSKNINLHPYHMEFIMRALEFYLLVIRQQFYDDFITQEQYDDLYFELYCLYHVFMFDLSNVPNAYRPIKIDLYKRINNRNYLNEALKKFVA